MKFIERLRQLDLLMGTMITLPSPEVTEMISHCGYDWLFLDGEHAPLSTLEWQRLMQATGGRCANLLRVAQGNEVAIKKALDIGVDGIIVPQVNTAEHAQAVVSWSKYPPQGSRGVGLGRAQGYGLYFSDYVERANTEIAVVIQAEHIDAVNSIEEIVKVPGVDAIFIGPYDLSASMDRMGEIDHPEVIAAIAKVTACCKKAKMPLGYFGVGAEAIKPYLSDGYTLICGGVDAAYITQGASEMLVALK
ncbi:MAG: 2-dehydro-3-deoxyglucarate aldolase [Saprospiraceae bacterium]|jgi:2-dehydro-3-deoxyglucarate aldolase